MSMTMCIIDSIVSRIRSRVRIRIDSRTNPIITSIIIGLIIIVQCSSRHSLSLNNRMGIRIVLFVASMLVIT